MTYQDILLDLYLKWYVNCQVSEVASDFWQNRSNEHQVSLENGQWVAKGSEGMTKFIPLNMKETIKHTPKAIIVASLLKQFKCNSNLVKKAREIAKSTNRVYDFGCVQQTLCLNEILNRLGGSFKNIKTICVIGDGYGYIGTLAKMFDPNIKVLFVNLGRTLFLDVLYTQRIFPNEKPLLLKKEYRKTFTEHKIIFLEAENYDMLSGLPIDLFININSMQEIEQRIIEDYFKYMRESSSHSVYFYCCNRLEKKMLKGEIISRFMEYPWEDSLVIQDELCPWWQKNLVGFIPKWIPLDGPFQHRFVKFK